MSNNQEVKITGSTGEICEESGLWRLLSAEKELLRPIAKGEIFPPYENREAVWELI